MKEFLNRLIISLLVTIFIVVFQRYYPNPTLFQYILLFSAILLFSYLILPILIKVKSLFFRRFKIVYPLIGILNGNITSPVREYKCKRVNTEITSSMWLSELKETLKSKKLKIIRVITTDKINDYFTIIVNPFGENFPEEDMKLHITFYKICDYIRKGGIFVCTGCAFWAHQNTKISDSYVWSFINIQNNIQSLSESLFFKEFGVQVTGDEFDKEKTLVKQEPLKVEIYQKEEDVIPLGDYLKENNIIERFRAVRPESSDYIPIIREKDNNSFPVAFVKYGDGYIIHAGMYLRSVASVEFKILMKILNHLITNKFKDF